MYKLNVLKQAKTDQEQFKDWKALESKISSPYTC